MMRAQMPLTLEELGKLSEAVAYFTYLAREGDDSEDRSPKDQREPGWRRLLARIEAQEEALKLRRKAARRKMERIRLNEKAAKRKRKPL